MKATYRKLFTKVLVVIMKEIDHQFLEKIFVTNIEHLRYFRSIQVEPFI